MIDFFAWILSSNARQDISPTSNTAKISVVSNGTLAAVWISAIACVCRANILEEVSNDPYRIAKVSPTEQGTVMEIDLGEQRSGIETLLNDPLLGQLASVSAIQNWLSSEIPTPVLIDLAIWAFCDNTEHRYGMLAEQDVENRAAWLQSQLKFTRRTLATAARFGDGQSSDGYSLN